RSKPGNVLVAGAIANADGSFRVQGLRAGTYALRVTYIGFGPRVQEFAIIASAPVVDVGAVAIHRVAAQLSGVEVKEQQSAVVHEADRTSYRAKDVAPGAGNASEVLDNVPAVNVDGDGKVSLRGNENVAVQINGRPSPITGAQLGAYLKSLPANIIDRVEVVPNPSAKYDPEGMAGIINLVLKANTDLGWSGGANAGVATLRRNYGSANVGYQVGDITTFSNLGINNDRRPVVGINDRDRFNALHALTGVTNQDIDSRQDNNGVNFNTNVDYKLTARDVFSNAIALNKRSGSDGGITSYEELNGARVLTDRYERPRYTDTKGDMVDYTMALKRTIEPRKHELGGEIRFNRSHDEDATSLWRQPTTAAGSVSPVRTDRELQNIDALTRTLNAQLDYTRPLSEKSKLETGYKGTSRWLDRDYQVMRDLLGSGSYVQSTQSNAFSFNEQVQAVYAVVSQSAGQFELQAGLRAEHANRDFTTKRDARSFPYSYNSVFPSGVVMYNYSDAFQTKLSYSRRVRRPGTQELNPFPSFFDVANVFIGNPALSPEYTDAVEMGFTRNFTLGTLAVSPFFRHTKDIIRVDVNTKDVIDGREVTSINFKNLATSNSWGTDVNGQLRLGPKFTGFAGFNVFRMVTDGGSVNSIGSDGVTWSTRLNGTTQLSPATSFQASWFYRAPMKIERGEFKAMQMVNLSLRQKISDRSTLGIRASDPFNTGRFGARIGNDDITQLSERSFGARAVFFTYQYVYGQQPRLRQPKPEEQQQGSSGFP
nr:TonB-dependent receptor [Gemmatimonadaceae bacterium]